MSFQRLSEIERAKLQPLRDRKEALLAVIRALERYSKVTPAVTLGDSLAR